MGRILDYGLIRMRETYGRRPIYNKTDVTNRLYHYFGDPSMSIYTQTPQKFSTPTIYSANDSLYIHVEDGDCRITFYNNATDELKSFVGNYAAYPNPCDNLIICLDRHNYVPYVVKAYSFGSADVYIQNEIIDEENRFYGGNKIMIGKNVNPTMPSGNVSIQNSNIIIHGKQLEIHSGTSILSNFEFKNQ